MSKRRKSENPGIPEWVVTFGDMMTLLLCFFILLAAFSELKKEREYQRVITAVKEAFGYSGGVGVMPTDDPPLRSMIQLLESMARQTAKEQKVSSSTDQGIRGKQTRVTRIHEGLQFTIGGSMTFEPGQAHIKPQMESELQRIADLLRGRNNKISVRGHAARKRLPEDSPFDDLWDLSYARAKNVADFLIGQGIRPEVISIEARGDTEPIEANRYDERAQEKNRRVEIIMTEALVDDFNSNHDYANEDVARGSDS